MIVPNRRLLALLVDFNLIVIYEAIFTAK